LLFAQDIEFMQKVADDWIHVCRTELGIDPGTLPWIIFYDSARSWHVSPDMTKIPANKRLNHSVSYNGKTYPIFEIEHSGSFWVPEREPMDANSLAVATMPYDDNRKSFFISPVARYFHRLGPPDQAQFLAILLAGLNIHELTHTRQLNHVIPQVLKAQKKYSLPESLDDNTIERTFEAKEDYKKLFFEEKTHLWNAVFANDRDSVNRELKTALDLAAKRKKNFFVGDHEGFKHVDDIFLALEGSAMWAQYQAILKYATPGPTPKQVLFMMLQATSSWSQEEGLALFMIINKLVPGWQKSFFSTELPSPIEMLKKYTK
jgi:hypothetical protein